MDEIKQQTASQAIRQRIQELLLQKKMSQYRLEQLSGISHSQMGFIMKDRNRSMSFTTVLQLCRGFNMALVEFFDSPQFNLDLIDIDKSVKGGG